ncbi:GntR family transcriptional regulator [Alteromonas oceanisediminis]|uniref:GntR family transcriptional regulator n=1 Tax=Alteromonas oceanisediminis TaxID=2836180 RepID=UPI001BDB15EE|nr:GntR family transcriptional regulator [Alteromonas oceanisediminis]MBT0585165.1 GntR family transcriptional regulator [Alteromonas oceanisediminis]
MESIESLNSLQVELTRKTIEFLKLDNVKNGDHITESLLIDYLNVSRTPVRAVLGFLAKAGVFTYVQNKGYYFNFDKSKLDSVVQKLPASEEDKLYFNIIRDCGKNLLPTSVNETELVNRYEIKRSVLTKTLNRLKQDGIIHRESGHGWKILVSPASATLKRDSYNFRLALEPASLLVDTFEVDQILLSRIKAEHKLTIDNSQRNIDSKRRTSVETMLKVFDMNRRFHELLAEFSNNQFYIESVKHQNRIRQVLEFDYMQTHDHIRIIQSCEEHLTIIDALSKNDREWASTLLKRHLSIAKDLT